MNPDGFRFLEVAVEGDVIEQAAVIAVDVGVELVHQLILPVTQDPGNIAAALESPERAQIFPVGAFQGRHVTVGHGQIDLAVHHVLNQHLGGGALAGLDAHVDTLLAQRFQAVHEGAVRCHHHGAPGQFLDGFERFVIGVANDLFVHFQVAVGETPAGGFAPLGNGHGPGDHIAGTGLQGVEHLRGAVAHHHAHAQVMLPGEVADQIVVETHQFAAPQKIAGRIVGGDHPQHAVLVDRRPIAALFTAHRGAHAVADQKFIDRRAQLRIVAAHRPGDTPARVDHRPLAHLIEGTQQAVQSVAVDDRRLIQTGGDALQQLHIGEPGLDDFNADGVVAFRQRFGGLLIGGAFGRGDTHFAQRLNAVALAVLGQHQILPYHRHRGTEIHFLLAGFGDRVIGDDQIGEALVEHVIEVIGAVRVHPARRQPQGLRQNFRLFAEFLQRHALADQRLLFIEARRQQTQLAAFAQRFQVPGFGVIRAPGITAAEQKNQWQKH